MTWRNAAAVEETARSARQLEALLQELSSIQEQAHKLAPATSRDELSRKWQGDVDVAARHPLDELRSQARRDLDRVSRRIADLEAEVLKVELELDSARRDLSLSFDLPKKINGEEEARAAVMRIQAAATDLAERIARVDYLRARLSNANSDLGALRASMPSIEERTAAALGVVEAEAAELNAKAAEAESLLRKLRVLDEREAAQQRRISRARLQLDHWQRHGHLDLLDEKHRASV